uniref:Uncharacterized protein n=1 Tax=mine drainage metagenome TaxID=410659 RepID=E6PYL6_9ZZZZ
MLFTTIPAMVAVVRGRWSGVRVLAATLAGLRIGGSRRSGRAAGGGASARTKQRKQVSSFPSECKYTREVRVVWTAKYLRFRFLSGPPAALRVGNGFACFGAEYALGGFFGGLCGFLRWLSGGLNANLVDTRGYFASGGEQSANLLELCNLGVEVLEDVFYRHANKVSLFLSVSSNVFRTDGVAKLSCCAARGVDWNR